MGRRDSHEHASVWGFYSMKPSLTPSFSRKSALGITSRRGVNKLDLGLLCLTSSPFHSQPRIDPIITSMKNACAGFSGTFSQFGESSVEFKPVEVLMVVAMPRKNLHDIIIDLLPDRRD